MLSWVVLFPTDDNNMVGAYHIIIMYLRELIIKVCLLLYITIYINITGKELNMFKLDEALK